MKSFKLKLLITCLLLAVCAQVFGDPMPLDPGKAGLIHKRPKVTKEMMKAWNAFRVKQVKFEKIVLNNQEHLAVGVIFNKNIDASTVQENLNIRLLKQDNNNYWVDASTQNNIVNVRPNFITWVSGAPVVGGVLYKMHLRGTIKSTDGKYLDCDGDGTGEGGALPAFESQTYQAPGLLLEEIIENR